MRYKRDMKEMLKKGTLSAKSQSQESSTDAYDYSTLTLTLSDGRGGVSRRMHVLKWWDALFMCITTMLGEIVTLNADGGDVDGPMSMVYAWYTNCLGFDPLVTSSHDSSNITEHRESKGSTSRDDYQQYVAVDDGEMERIRKLIKNIRMHPIVENQEPEPANNGMYDVVQRDVRRW